MVFVYSCLLYGGDQHYTFTRAWVEFAGVSDRWILQLKRHAWSCEQLTPGKPRVQLEYIIPAEPFQGTSPLRGLSKRSFMVLRVEGC